MTHLRVPGILVTLWLVGSPALAQEDRIEVTRLTERIHLLATDQGSYTTNTLAFVTDDGVLLVDTQSRADAESLKQAVDAFGKGTPRYIINTHRHVEHIGGNALFGEDPVIIAHARVPAKLTSGSYVFNEFPPATYPDITLTDSLTLYFGGERIRILALPGGHDDNEIIVHFTDSKVVHLSSLVNGFNFPSVDGEGDALRFAELVSRAIGLLPEDVLVVSGHNGTGTWDDLHAYRDMLLETADAVRRGLDEGKDLETLQREGALSPWSAYAGSYVSVDGWTEYLVDAYQDDAEPRKTVFEPLYTTWKERGAESAVDLYRELKRDHRNEYGFYETELLVIGSKLLENGHARAGVTFLEASLEEDPDSDFAYYAEYKLAEALAGLGDAPAARLHCDRSLALQPEFEPARRLRGTLGSD